MRKTITQKVEELHATLPDDFKNFVRKIAAVPKAAIQAEDAVKPNAAKKRKLNSTK